MNSVWNAVVTETRTKNITVTAPTWEKGKERLEILYDWDELCDSPDTIERHVGMRGLNLEMTRELQRESEETK